LLACLDARELVEWRAFFALEAEDRDNKQKDPEVTSEQLKADLMSRKG